MIDALSRPELTLPPAEAEALRAAYGAADVILEYGSGGSTVMAAELPGKQVFSVESDVEWVKSMRRWFKASPPASGTQVDIIWSDIGPTKAWGHPVNTRKCRRWPSYPLEVWSLPEFRHPDVVLVDGRFRQACALSCAFMAERPVTLFIDDYTARDFYRKVEPYLGPPDIIGRMAKFHVTPQPIPPQRLLQVVNFFLHP